MVPYLNPPKEFFNKSIALKCKLLVRKEIAISASYIKRIIYFDKLISNGFFVG